MNKTKLLEMISKVEKQIENEQKTNGNETTNTAIFLQGKREALTDILTEIINEE